MIHQVKDEYLQKPFTFFFFFYKCIEFIEKHSPRKEREGKRGEERRGKGKGKMKLKTIEPEDLLAEE